MKKNINTVVIQRLIMLLVCFLGYGSSLIAQSPGGVQSSDLELWLRADIGTGTIIDNEPISTWIDQSPNSNNGNSTENPIFRSAAVENIFNYNPSIQFEAGTRQHLLATLSISDNLINSSELFMVAINDGNSNSGGRKMFGIRQLSNPENHQLDHYALRETRATAYDGAFIGRSFSSVPESVGIYSVTLNNPSDLFNVYFNNFLIASDNSFISNTGIDGVTIGGDPSGEGDNDAFGGNMAEFIHYDVLLTPTEKVQVSSYLSIKYGLTISNTGGGINGDYLASNGSNIWDASLSPSYHNDVIGIGRDNTVGTLLQKQSHTSDDTTRIYIDNLTIRNEQNAGSFSNDISYVTIGHNTDKMCASAVSNTEIPTGLTDCDLISRLEREWKVTNTNFNDDFNLDLTLNTCAVLGAVNPNDLRLLVDTDSDFGNGGTTCYYNGDGSGIVITYNNPIVTISGISTSHVANNSTRFITVAAVSPTSTLPVELLSFEAKPIDNNNEIVKLIWQTASEINNDYFTIERSKDGTEWETIAQNDGAGNSSVLLDYSTYDKDPYSGVSYYRLKQTDFDGQFEYSQIRSVNIERFENSHIEIYPNPADNQITIIGNESELDKVKIYNVLGQDVTSFTQKSNINNSKLIIELSNLIKGMYYIKTKTTTNRVIKQ